MGWLTDVTTPSLSTFAHWCLREHPCFAPAGIGRSPQAKQVAAVAAPRDGRKMLFNVDTLVPLLKRVGFRAILLEYFEPQGRFHAREWDSADGYVERSSKYDRRDEFKLGTVCHTSLIVDATRATEPDVAPSDPVQKGSTKCGSSAQGGCPCYDLCRLPEPSG